MEAHAVNEEVFSKMQSLENKIESKLKEIDKMFDANALQANRAVDEQLQQEV